MMHRLWRAITDVWCTVRGDCDSTRFHTPAVRAIERDAQAVVEEVQAIRATRPARRREQDDLERAIRMMVEGGRR